MKKRWESFSAENLSYKIVSLFIALILWFTILGRRDFVYTKTVDVEFITDIQNAVVAQSSDRIKLRVSGARPALKKFMEANSSQILQIDISKKGNGVFDVDVPINKIEIPMGIKILGIRPNVIRVEVVKK